MNKVKPVVIIDGDDTLWKTQELYDKAKLEFNDLMKKEGFPNSLEFFDGLDASRTSRLLFKKSRFFESMLITYAIHCGRYKRNWNTETESAIRELGFSIFKLPPELYNDTMSSLHKLSGHFTLVLMTNGDEEIQKEKISSLGNGFVKYFSTINIPAVKTVEEYSRIVNESKVSYNNVWMIGNSIKSDIRPAFNLGIRCILIPHKTWIYEEDELPDKNVATANSLSEAVGILFKEYGLKNE